MGDTLGDFAGSMLIDETIADDLRGKRQHALRRGRLITDEELLQGEQGEAEAAEGRGAEGEAEAEAEGLDPTMREVKWSSCQKG
eukprot:426165-Prymnesium_polylepis.2